MGRSSKIDGNERGKKGSLLFRKREQSSCTHGLFFGSISPPVSIIFPLYRIINLSFISFYKTITKSAHRNVRKVVHVVGDMSRSPVARGRLHFAKPALANIG